MSRPQNRFTHSNNLEEAFHKAAIEWGVEREYWDIFGNHHVASADIERRVLASFGVDVSSAETVDQARKQRFQSKAATLLAPTSVVSETDRAIELALLSYANSQLRLELTLEEGGSLSSDTHVGVLKPLRDLELDGQWWTVYHLPLPEATPLGYHRASLRVDGQLAAQASVIVCPDRAYLPEPLRRAAKTAGISATLWGLRSHRNWGCGDFTDLHAFIDWVVKDICASFIALNPLHSTLNRFPFNTSPYLPLSIFYKNFIYLDIERVPEFKKCPSAQQAFVSLRIQAKLAELRASEFVQYERVSSLKKQFLKLLYRAFCREAKHGSERSMAFQSYCDCEGELLDKFALYCALDDFLHKQDRNWWTWRDWPEAVQSPESEECRRFAVAHKRTIEFHKYVQFVVDEQLSETQQYAKARGMSIGLYHDLALATDSCGADLWAHRSSYIAGCRVGSPPDGFAPNGQDWGFPPPNTIAHYADGYRLFRASIRKIVRYGGALRIDHVMRLFRLFWIPEGTSAVDGVYVRDNVVDLLRILALESVRNTNIIIGEDLGTVTDEMRNTLERFGILSYRLFYFEKRKDDSFKRSSEYPRQALVSSTTHDLPTIVGFWTYRDIEARRAAGLVDEDGYQHQMKDRRLERQRLLDTLHAEGLLPADYPRDARTIGQLDGDLHNAIIGFLSQTPSALLLLNHEDLTKEPDQQNLPGSTDQYPNWSRKMRYPVEELGTKVGDFTAMLRENLRRAERVEHC
jgi:4-alpha-glucanotransferase